MRIHICAIEGDICGIEHQLMNGANINCLDDEYPYQTPLMYATTSDEAGIDVLQFLLDNGADVNKTDEESGNTALLLAAESGDFDKIQFLLNIGADIHHQNNDGDDLMIKVMYNPQINSRSDLVSILKLLVEKGAHIAGLNCYKESALKEASRLGKFDAVKFLLDAGADSNQLEWTELMHAIAFGSLGTIKEFLGAENQLIAQDFCGRNPWMLCLQVGDLDKAKLLLSAGANRNDLDYSGKPPWEYPIAQNNVKILEWLIEEEVIDVEATDVSNRTALMIAASYGAVDCVRLLLDYGANPAHEDEDGTKAIHLTSNIEIFRMLITPDDDLSALVNKDDGPLRRALTKVDYQKLQVTREEYLTGRYRRFGTSNPDVMDIPFWSAMVCDGRAAYAAVRKFDDNDQPRHPVWCFDRFGRTATELLDGRVIEIAGEHEDFYDPDFCIYNDVVVYQGDGNFKILGYPKDVFPPTDFHTATLVGDYIYIIGNLGYPQDRILGETPVYRLDCNSFKIELIETSGAKPGWISSHKACFKKPHKINITGGSIFSESGYQENLAEYSLNLISFTWSCINP